MLVQLIRSDSEILQIPPHLIDQQDPYLLGQAATEGGLEESTGHLPLRAKLHHSSQ